MFSRNYIIIKLIITYYSKLKEFIKFQGKLFAGSGILTFFRLLAGLILLKIAAVTGGNSAVAIYGQAHNLATMFNGILSSGVGEGVIKMTAQNQTNFSKINIIKSSSLFLIGFCSLVVIFISSIFWTFFVDWTSLGNLSSYQIIIYLFGALVASIGTLLISLANGFQLLNDVIRTNIASIFLALIISGLILFYFEKNVILIIPAIYLGLIGIFQIGILISKIQLPRYFFSMFDLSTIYQLGGFMLMAMGSFIMTPIALVTIRGWLIQDFGTESAGDWESSRKLSELITALITAYFAMVLLPKLAKIPDSKVLRIEIIKNAFAIIILSFLGLSFLYLLREQIYFVIFSSDFKFSSELISSRAIGEFLRCLVWIFGFILVIKAKVKIYLSLGLINMIVLLVTSWLLIADYGIVGANYAYIVSNTIMLIISIITFYYVTFDSHNGVKL